MKDSDVIDVADPTRNMYGCAPCPECGDNHRFARQSDLVIVCDECGYEEQGRMAENDS